MINSIFDSTEYLGRLKDFKELLRKAVGEDLTYAEFYIKANLKYEYMNNLINGRNTNFPHPEVLEKIANNSEGRVTKDELMRVCGHLKLQFIPRKQLTVKRGDIYYVDLGTAVGSVQGGVRPVLVIQNDTGNLHSPTVIVSAITSQMTKAKLPTHVPLGQDTGLDKDSIVLLEQIRTVDKSELGDYVGHITDTDKVKINKAYKISGGVWGIEDMIIENLNAENEPMSLLRKVWNVVVDMYKKRELVFNRVA